MNIYTQEELVEYNNMMLGRGAPTERDGVGYNRPDYGVCINYFDSLTPSQVLDLAQRLYKYLNTQLSIDKEKLMNTIEYYKKESGGKDPDKAISVQVRGEYTLVAFKYNPDFINVCKKASDRKYLPEEKVWLIHNTEIMSIIDRLEVVGADVTGIKKYLNDNINVKETKKKEKERIIKAREKKGKLELKFDFDFSKYDEEDAKILNSVKSLIDRKFDAEKKVWVIAKEEVNALIDMLKKAKVKNLNIEELKKYKQEDNGYHDIQLTAESNLEPYNHQIEAAKFLIAKKKAILGDEMGGGKTLSSIIAGMNITGRKLIVCPASLKLNWKKEINRATGDEAIVINGGEWQDAEWIIINYDILKKHINIIKQADFKVAIFDESHYIKAVNNSGKPMSDRAKLSLQIADQVEYVFTLTGTPIPNKTKDIFNTLKAIKHPLSKNFFMFGKRYCSGFKNAYGWNFEGSSNQNELYQHIQPYMMRRLKHELLDLPKKVRSFIPTEINKKEYETKLEEYMQARKSIDNKGEHLVYLNAMRHILAKEKTKHTIEQVKNVLDQNGKVVVFTCYDYVVKKVIEEFQDNVVKLTGDCNQNERQNAVDDFQNGKVDVFVANIQAGGVGITLTESKNVIFNDFDWTPANHAQAEDRIHRIGQDESCNIYYMYAENALIDVKMSDLLESKLRNITEIIDGKDDETFVDQIIESIAEVTANN